MNYKEFKKTYNYMVKKYPDTTSLYFDNEKNIGQCTINNFVKVGSKWVLKETKTENCTNIYYCNVIDAIPFFKSLGGREIVTKCYTKYGLIPIEVISVSPDKTEKTTRWFKFD